MKELVERVAQKVGISTDQATTAVQTVMGFLKDKLPAQMGTQLERMMGTGGGESAEPPASGVTKQAGDIGAQVGEAIGKRKTG